MNKSVLVQFNISTWNEAEILHSLLSHVRDVLFVRLFVFVLMVPVTVLALYDFLVGRVAKK